METPVTMIRPTAAADSVAQLRLARQFVAEGFAADEPLKQTALDLIDCATDVVGRLPDGDLESAREALGSARAAVVSATYAVRRIHDTSRAGRGPSGHILVIHRWRDRHALYDQYIDHDAHRVTYVTTGLGEQSVPAAAAAVRTIPATDDFPQVMAAVRDLSARFGPPDRVVALNEGDLDTAALVREELRCAGQDTRRLARFRDKLVMAEVIAAAGIAAPAYADAPDEAAIRAFAAAHGWPVIVKPRKGTASRDVFRLDSAADLARLRDLPAEPRLVQTFCGDAIYHIDGLWTGDRLGPWRASRYVNTCVDFTQGEVLGSVEVDDADLLPALGEFTTAVAGALSEEPLVFHLEVFVGTDPDGRPRLTFLEAGYRVGGAEIPFVWREVHGIDLMRAAIDIQLGRRPDLPVPAEWRIGGWLLVPAPVPTPCRVTACDLPEPPTPEEGPYAQVVPQLGQLIPKVGGYEHVGARFRFRGDSSGDVEKAIVSTASQFRLECEPQVTLVGAACVR